MIIFFRSFIVFQSKYLPDRLAKSVLLPGRREWDLLPAIQDRETTIGELRLQQLTDIRFNEYHARLRFSVLAKLFDQQRKIVKNERVPRFLREMWMIDRLIGCID